MVIYIDFLMFLYFYGKSKNDLKIEHSYSSTHYTHAHTYSRQMGDRHISVMIKIFTHGRPAQAYMSSSVSLDTSLE